MIGYIYKIICPIKKSIIYVGATTLTLESRLKSHLADCKSTRTVFYEYLQTLKKPPVIELLEEVSFRKEQTLFNAERKWILYFKKNGIELLNKNHFKTEKRVMVGVTKEIRNKVAKKLAGTGFTIGWFFDESAKEMLKPYDGKNSIVVKQIKKQ